MTLLQVADWTPIITSLILLAGGGAGVKLLEYFASGRTRQSDEMTAIRQEMRERIDKLEARTEELKVEVDGWQTKYFAVDREIVALQVRLQACEESRLGAIEEKHSAEIAVVKAEAATEVVTAQAATAVAEVSKAPAPPLAATPAQVEIVGTMTTTEKEEP